jgi:hypothetical protein
MDCKIYEILNIIKNAKYPKEYRAKRYEAQRCNRKKANDKEKPVHDLLSFCWGFRLHRSAQPVGVRFSLPRPYTYIVAQVKEYKQGEATGISRKYHPDSGHIQKGRVHDVPAPAT